MQRVVLLGASNLTVSFPLLLESLHRAFPERLEILAAHGHGRSYGQWSRVLVRSLPGITQCRIWGDLERRANSDGRTFALLTDIGNDLLYGVSAAKIAEWVETCLERLAEHEADITLTLLPMDSVERLSAWRYHLTKMFFFPRSGLTYPKMLGQAAELNERLLLLGERMSVRTFKPPGDWYGFDPIHIRHRRRRRAWAELLAGWSDFNRTVLAARTPLHRRLSLWRLPPAERRLLGRRFAAEQPVHSRGETTLSLY